MSEKWITTDELVWQCWIGIALNGNDVTIQFDNDKSKNDFPLIGRETIQGIKSHESYRYFSIYFRQIHR